jgi:SAM-dependent methyltransferase
MDNLLVSAARRLLDEQRARQDGRNSSVVHLPASENINLNRVAASATRRHVRQVITVSSETLDPDSFEHALWREVAKQGIRTERIYLVPHSGFAANAVQRQYALDREAGVTSRILVVGRIPIESHLFQLHSLWLIDGESIVSARSELGLIPTYHWTVSSCETDVRWGETEWSQLWDLSGHLTSSTHLDLEEPLVLTADLINGIAPVMCSSDHVDRTGCNWYHGTWQYLRLLQMVSTPTWHHDFYLGHLTAALETGQVANALITGTADYSMLAYLIEASRVSGHLPKLNVLDLCATPLFACRWYATRSGLSINTYEADIKDFSESARGTFDLICTDAFLTRFRRDSFESVVSAWRRLLRVNGVLVTTVRIHERSESVRNQETAIRDFRDRASARAKRWEVFLRKSSAEIGELAEVYARRMTSQVVSDEQEVIALLTHCNLRVTNYELGTVPGELAPTIYLRLHCVAQ